MNQNKWRKQLCYVLFTAYMVILFYFLLFSEGFNRTTPSEEYRYNLIPFQEIRRFILYYQVVGVESMLVNIIGNIVAFVPFGFFMSFLGYSKRGFFHVTLLTIELSLFVELVQLITKVGSYDVDDLILNSLGGILGFIVYKVGSCIIEWRKKYGISKEEGKL